MLSVREIHRKGRRCSPPYFRYYPADAGGGRPYIDRTGENGTPPARCLSSSLPTSRAVRRDADITRLARVRRARAVVKSRSLNKSPYVSRAVRTIQDGRHTGARTHGEGGSERDDEK